MRNLAVLVATVLTTLTVNAQGNTIIENDTWMVFAEGNSTDAYTLNNVIIEGRTLNQEETTYFVYDQSLKNDEFIIDFTLTNMPYTYNENGIDNGLGVKVMVDDKELEFRARIMNHEGDVEIESVDGFNSTSELYTALLKGKTLYTQVSAGGNSFKHVFKYNVSGFKEIDEAMENALRKVPINPFN